MDNGGGVGGGGSDVNFALMHAPNNNIPAWGRAPTLGG